MEEFVPGILTPLDGHHQYARIIKTSPPTIPYHCSKINEMFFGGKDPAFANKRHQKKTGVLVFKDIHEYATGNRLNHVLANLVVQKKHIENCMFPLSIPPFEKNANGQYMQQRDTKCEIFFSIQSQSMFFGGGIYIYIYI